MKLHEYKIIAIAVPVTQEAEDWERTIPRLGDSLWTAEKVGLRQLQDRDFAAQFGRRLLQSFYGALK